MTTENFEEQVEIPADQIATGDYVKAGRDDWRRVRHVWSWGPEQRSWRSVGLQLEGLYFDQVTPATNWVTVRRTAP